MPMQRTLGDFFPTIMPAQRQRHIKRAFKRERDKQVKQLRMEERTRAPHPGRDDGVFHHSDRTFSCVTQNVNGFGRGAGRYEEWFRAFRQEDTHGRYDVVFLQETHVEAPEVAYIGDIHARAWGFRNGPQDPALSFWSAAQDNKAGVAVLVNPYGHIKNARPALQAYWTQHFMAIAGEYAGTTCLYICVYAPHQRAQRETFYRRLGNIDLPFTDNLIVGGDFNCTLDSRLDRSYYR